MKEEFNAKIHYYSNEDYRIEGDFASDYLKNQIFTSHDEAYMAYSLWICYLHRNDYFAKNRDKEIDLETFETYTEDFSWKLKTALSVFNYLK